MLSIHFIYYAFSSSSFRMHKIIIIMCFTYIDANVGVCMRWCAYCCDFFYYYYIQELWYIFSDMIRDMTGDDTQKRLISKAQSWTRKKMYRKTVEHIVSSKLSHIAVKYERMEKEQQQRNRKRFPIDIISRCWFGFIILTWVLRNTHARTHPHRLSNVACKREQIYEINKIK